VVGCHGGGDGTAVHIKNVSSRVYIKMERKKNVSEVVVVRCYDGSGGHSHYLGGGRVVVGCHGGGGDDHMCK
jgi:hypothetical protein